MQKVAPLGAAQSQLHIAQPITYNHQQTAMLKKLCLTDFTPWMIISIITVL